MSRWKSGVPTEMAYDFNGSNQYFSTSSTPVVSEPLTISAWFKSDLNNARTVIACLVDTEGAVAGLQGFFALVEDGTKAGDPICATKHDGGGGSAISDEATSTSGFVTGTWYHGCAVFTSNTSRTVYINGGSSSTNTTNVPNLTNAADRIAIGCLGRSTPVAFYNGQVADVGIWNEALSASEIASLAKGYTCDKIRPQSLVFYAPLVRDLVDVRGGRAITNNNTATVANHPRVYA